MEHRSIITINYAASWTNLRVFSTVAHFLSINKTKTLRQRHDQRELFWQLLHPPLIATGQLTDVFAAESKNPLSSSSRNLSETRSQYDNGLWKSGADILGNYRTKISERWKISASNWFMIGKVSTILFSVNAFGVLGSIYCFASLPVFGENACMLGE